MTYNLLATRVNLDPLLPTDLNQADRTKAAEEYVRERLGALKRQLLDSYARQTRADRLRGFIESEAGAVLKTDLYLVISLLEGLTIEEES